MVNANLLFDNSAVGTIVQTMTTYGMQGILNRMVGASAGEMQTVELSGWFFVGQSGAWYQTTGGEWVIDADCVVVGKATNNVSSKEVQRMIDRLISNNKRIYENNLICARFASKLTDAERKQLTALQGRLTLRDTALRMDNNLTGKTENYPAGYIQEYGYLESIMQQGGVGIVVTTTAMIVITAIVTASVALAIYFAFKYWCSESEQDVKYSDSLTKTLLAKLTPEEYEQLKRETAGMITKSKLKAKFQAGGSLLKWGVIAVGCGFVYKAYRDGNLNPQKLLKKRK